MTKEELLELLQLLSAMESWSFSASNATMPEYIYEKLDKTMEIVKAEILK